MENQNSFINSNFNFTDNSIFIIRNRKTGYHCGNYCIWQIPPYTLTPGGLNFKLPLIAKLSIQNIYQNVRSRLGFQA